MYGSCLVSGIGFFLAGGYFLYSSYTTQWVDKQDLYLGIGLLIIALIFLFVAISSIFNYETCKVCNGTGVVTINTGILQKGYYDHYEGGMGDGYYVPTIYNKETRKCTNCDGKGKVHPIVY